MDNAFSGTILTEAELPAGLEYLGATVFEHCPNLAAVTVQGEQTRICFDTWKNNLFSDVSGEIPENFVLYGYTNSMVEEYARIKGCGVELYHTGRIKMQNITYESFEDKHGLARILYPAGCLIF